MWQAVLALATMWVTNLYNFMDGSDGLAGGMALFGFGAYALAAWLAGDAVFVVVAASIAAAAAAFLVFNFPPAKVFMGDAGSIPLGFLAAALGILGWRAGHWPLWFPVLVFSPFIIDASVTLARRLLRGERVWRAHRSHYYQRLVQLGWGHRNTALAEYALMAGCGAARALGARSAGRGSMGRGRCSDRRVSRARRARRRRVAAPLRTHSRAMFGRINWRNTVAFLHDVVAAAAAWVLAYLLRFNFELYEPYATAMVCEPRMGRAGAGRGLPVAAACTGVCGATRACPTSGASSSRRCSAAMAVAVVVVLLRRPDVPRSVLVLYPLLLAMIMGGSRIAYRAWKEGHLRRLGGDGKRVIVLGAGDRRREPAEEASGAARSGTSSGCSTTIRPSSGARSRACGCSARSRTCPRSPRARASRSR